ncbi:Haloacid Dehalogenase Superfamily Class (subfamily) IIA [Actinopolymorpha cephalotaxi]|uniref:HAD superfamily hydrolase (TIGR01450 family) n=1 Tax=Actinopolymorpha cephalotaxi TaxID=504797 RepID=A0A1I2VT04_9ACTN|nr:HAD-IIA family hydrolase [Actinopolymorpha cephalotaxi]NYH83203.1 HAD superfamily hydrolase (TIGR01450 family) [Actinopolymorpha cephalotaxi]SFG91569.1 Haloacid Dehalogenase Superfamily Class (subfamily) IIA [Actinopolymorpha cephalotaxi]
MTDETTTEQDAAPEPLSEADRPLVEQYDAGLFDLDGVVYVGADAVPRAPEDLERARAAAMKVAFVTNNASRTPDAVVEHLRKVGVRAEVGDVVTSAQAAARLVAERVPVGSRVLVVGGEGLLVAIRERGLVPVRTAAEDPAAVVQGFHPEVGWRQLAEGAYAVRRNVPWIASNVDRTLPTDGGLAPGNGTLVEVIRMATGQTPVIAGKPAPPLFRETVERVGAERPLVIGDRLDTDIEGANAAGMPSMLVLTGVSKLADLLTAPENQRPTYLARDLAGLFASHPAPRAGDGSATCGEWTATLERQDAAGADGRKGQLVVRLSGSGDPLDGARALLAAVWTATEPARIDASEALALLRGQDAAMG